MLLRCGLLLAILSCVRTWDDYHRDGLIEGLHSEFNRRFSLWPSVHNAATLLRIRREIQAGKSQVDDKQAPSTGVLGPSEGDPKKPAAEATQPPAPTEHNAITVPLPQKVEHKDAPKEILPLEPHKAKNSSNLSNETPKDKPPEVSQPTILSPTPTAVTVKNDGTNAEKATKNWELNNPEATKRGLIVFGGFALLAMAYFIFYRTKSKFNDTNNSNGMGESNQFRYGVLQSDDRKDNLELSRVPLTMESDEDEDEDLEIFDLEQKKKSLSYVNLQGNDEEIVMSPRSRDELRDDLLLDIEDGNSDILINWSNNGSKSIL